MNPLLDPNYQRGNILPIVKDTRTGERSFGAPQIVVDLLSALMLPGDVYKGNVLLRDPETGQISDEVIKRSTDLAGAMTLGSGAIPADDSLRVGMKMYHGSPMKGLDELRPSQSGAMGPGVYATPFQNVARRYGDEIYEFPVESSDVFNGLGRMGVGDDENYFQVWRDQAKRLVEAAPEEKKQMVAEVISRLSADDGYPLLRDLAYKLGSKEKALELFKRAGFKGVSGHIDGPEVLLFDPVPLRGGHQ